MLVYPQLRNGAWKRLLELEKMTLIYVWKIEDRMEEEKRKGRED